jgi:hypothetical protein
VAVIRRVPRKPCDHSPLLAEIEALRAANARLKARLAYYQILQWMHAAIVQRDRQAKTVEAEAVRVRTIGGEPTAVYATEHFRRPA